MDSMMLHRGQVASDPASHRARHSWFSSRCHCLYHIHTIYSNNTYIHTYIHTISSRCHCLYHIHTMYSNNTYIHTYILSVAAVTVSITYIPYTVIIHTHIHTYIVAAVTVSWRCKVVDRGTGGSAVERALARAEVRPVSLISHALRMLYRNPAASPTCARGVALC